MAFASYRRLRMTREEMSFNLYINCWLCSPQFDVVLALVDAGLVWDLGELVLRSTFRAKHFL